MNRTHRPSHLTLARAIAGIAGVRSFCFDPEGIQAGATAVADEPDTGEETPATPPAPSEPFARLRDEFAQLHREASTLVDAATTAGRELTAEEVQANDRRFNRMQAIRRLQDEQVRFAGLALRGEMPVQTAGGGSLIVRPREIPGREEFERSAGRIEISSRATIDPEVIQRHRDAINNYIRTGEIVRSRQFVLTTGTGTGALLPTRVGPPITLRRQLNPYRAAIMSRALEIIRTPGMEAMNVPVFDDTANTADIIAENNTSENNKDPAATALVLTPVLYDSGTVWASNMLLQSIGFDLLGYLEPMLDMRIWRRELTAWTTTLLATVVIGKTTAGVNTVTYDELLDWQHSVPVENRIDGVFMVSDGLFRAVRGLKDSTGQPIYQSSLRDDAPDTLLGWPIFVTDALATPATGVISGIAASASSLFIREAGQRHIVRYANIPTHPDQFGIREFAYGAFAFNSPGVRALKHA